MTIFLCQWCGRPADGLVKAAGLDAPIYDCGSPPCWEQSYQRVKRLVPRTWKLIDQAKRSKAPQPGPDLFDFLPNEGEKPHER